MSWALGLLMLVSECQGPHFANACVECRRLVFGCWIMKGFRGTVGSGVV